LILNALLIILHRFATLATRMEQYIQGQSRDLVDQAYTKFVSDSFKTLSCFYDVYCLSIFLGNQALASENGEDKNH